MFKKILIANRGEIASRIIHTCKKLHIQTVAIYSDADKHLPFVRLADESYRVGEAQVQHSYLHMDKIISIAQKSNVDAIHPGYGFLSENSTFAKKCATANITFIGPSHDIIEKMGDKVKAKDLMCRAGVPVIPGTRTALSNVEEAMEVAKEFGYPIMLKAAAGGGGVGMEIVTNDEELKQAFANNEKRAESLFGNRALFLEKAMQNVRHIEVQVLIDEHFNGVHLFERECSIQRRNQKVIEEAPATFLSSKTRHKMGEIALYAAKKIGYTNAGTIEFLVDDEENFYFLEMNTRIQVEHRITEAITNIDIVEQQLHIAANKPLPFEQKDIEITGHAIEARIYAEDPNTFFPSPGKITTYEEPTGDHVIIDATVEENTTVTPFYDPMISKLIVYGDSRETTIKSMHKALKAYKIAGIKTNIPLLLNIIEDESFKLGHTKTNYMEQHTSQ